MERTLTGGCWIKFCTYLARMIRLYNYYNLFYRPITEVRSFAFLIWCLSNLWTWCRSVLCVISLFHRDMKSSVFWAVTQRWKTAGRGRFGNPYWSHFHVVSTILLASVLVAENLSPPTSVPIWPHAHFYWAFFFHPSTNEDETSRTSQNVGTQILLNAAFNSSRKPKISALKKPFG